MSTEARSENRVRESARATYRMLRLIREFEERIHTEFPSGDIPGAVHLYAGQEAVAAGVCAELTRDDYVASTHRGHGHAVAKGCDLTAMMLELFGKRAGLCGGKGGSMHLADFDLGMLGANGVAAGGVPLACGAAFSARMRGTDQVAVAFVGDGGANQGAFAESLVLASVWRLPCVFVVEDNGYAQSTGTPFHLGGRDVAPRAEAHGIPTAVVDGYDVTAVRGAAAEAVHRARSGGGPSLLECEAHRFYGHMEGFDQQAYRGAGEVDRLRAEYDCVENFTRSALADGSLSHSDIRAVDAKIRAELDHAVATARAAEDPAADDVVTDVYVGH